MVCDASGNIYIAGSLPVSGQGYNYDIIKLNSNLSLAWEHTYNGYNLNDIAAGIKVDANSNVYVTGTSSTSSEGKNIVTLKYNSSGALQWTQTYNDTLDKDDEAAAMAIDATGNIYIAGSCGTESDSTNYLTMKYDASGNLLWTIQSDGDAHLDDRATNIAIDTDGNVIVTGESRVPQGAAGNYEYLTIKYVEKYVITPTDYYNESPAGSFSYYCNKGQLLGTNDSLVPDIKYYNQGSSPAFYFKDNSCSFVFAHIDGNDSIADTLHRIDLNFDKVNTSVKTYPMEETTDYNNYYLGHCPEGITKVHGNKRLVTTDLYPGIDLMYSSNQNGIKMYFVIKPGGKISDIQLRFCGASLCSIDSLTNALTINSPIGSLTFEQPHAYQIDSNNVIDSISNWTAQWQTNGADSAYKFNIGAYDSAKVLVILVDEGHNQFVQSLTGSEWSTYFGNQSNVGMSYVNDSKIYLGYLYVTGSVYGNDFPIVNGFQPSSSGSWDAFISKFNTSGYELNYSTYLGGNMEDECFSIDVNNQCILTTGLCQGTTFPVYPQSNPNDGSYWQNNPNDDIMGIIVKLNLNGLRERITCFGGPGTTKIFSGKLDDNSNVYITGYTNVIDVAECVNGNPPVNAFPLQQYGTAYYQDTHQYLSTNDLDDAFVAKFSNNNVILWSSIFGGNRNDYAMDIAINVDNIYIVGATSSLPDIDYCIAANSGFPLCTSGIGYFQGYKAGGNDGFMAKFDINGSLIHSTYIGGSSEDCLTDISTNSSGDCYILGITESESDPDYNSNTPPDISHKLRIYDPGNTAKRQINNGSLSGATDMVMFRFAQNNELQWSTYIGGQNTEIDYTIYDPPILYSCDLYTDTYNNTFIIGATNSTDCGTMTASGSINCTYNAMFDTYLIGYNNNNEKRYGTYIGGSMNDASKCITGTNNKLYFAGTTGSTDYPTQQYTLNPLSYYREDQTPSYYDSFITSCWYSNSLDIYEIKADYNMRIYPNPCSQSLQVQLLPSNRKKWDVRILDIYGNICFTNTYFNNEFSINIENFSSGAYIIECLQPNIYARSILIVE